MDMPSCSHSCFSTAGMGRVLCSWPAHGVASIPATHRQRSRALNRSLGAHCIAGLRRELPIFPLNTVAYPSAKCPLHIFEA